MEVRLGQYRARVDAVGADGELIEVQAAPLTALRPKLGRLLDAGQRVRVVKPVVVAKRIVKKHRVDGPELPGRLSPRRGRLYDVFDDFVGLAALFPAPGLVIEVLGVDVDEVRLPRRRRPGYKVLDRRLREVAQVVHLIDATDLWHLLPVGLPERFTTLDLAAHLDRPIHFAQRVAYCLRLAGAATTAGKNGNRIIYHRPEGSPPSRPLGLLH
jgi:hypothetical protein